MPCGCGKGLALLPLGAFGAQVLLSKCARTDANSGSQPVDLLLQRDLDLHATEAAHRARDPVVRVGEATGQVDGGPGVGALSIFMGGVEDLGAVLGIGAGISDQIDLMRGQAARGIGTAAHADDEGVALDANREALFPPPDQPHRPTGHVGEERGNRLRMETVLAAIEPPTGLATTRTCASGSASMAAISRASALAQCPGPKTLRLPSVGMATAPSGSMKWWTWRGVT